MKIIFVFLISIDEFLNLLIIELTDYTGFKNLRNKSTTWEV